MGKSNWCVSFLSGIFWSNFVYVCKSTLSIHWHAYQHFDERGFAVHQSCQPCELQKITNDARPFFSISAVRAIQTDFNF